MTAPPNGQAPLVLFDPGNPFLGEHPANLSLGKTNTPAGERVILTIRQAGSTVTVLLTQQDAKAWAAQLERAASNTSKLIIPNGVTFQAPPPPGPGGHR